MARTCTLSYHGTVVRPWLLGSAVALIAVALTAAPAVAQSRLGGRACEWFDIPLPSSQPLVEFDLSSKGLLFVATGETVYVRDPAPAGGWRSIFELSKVSDDPDDQITTIGVARAKTGFDDESLFVISDRAAWAISWDLNRKAGPTWSALRFVFEVKAIPRPSPPSFTALHRTKRGPTVAFVGDSGGTLAVIEQGSQGPKIRTLTAKTDSAPLFSNGLANSTLVWGYRQSVLLVLSNSGAVVDQHVFKASATRPAPIIHRAVAITDRQLVAVATSEGLWVMRQSSRDGHFASRPVRVESLKGRDLRWVGNFVGRIGVGVAHEADFWGVRSTVAIEPGNRAFVELSDLKFAALLGGPSNLAAVASHDDDLIFVEGVDGVYERAPDRWIKLADPAGVIEDISVSSRTHAQAGLSVFSDLLGEKLVGCRHRTDGWTTFELPEAATAGAVVPDPSGRGVWLIERPVSGVGSMAGYVRFVSPHGVADTTDGTSYGVGHTVDRIRLIGRDGRVSWPESALGGLLLPIGHDFLWVDNGRWHYLPWTQADSLRHLVPAGESGTDGWLGLRRDAEGRTEVVRLDASGSLGRPTGLSTRPTGIACDRAERARLVVDSERHVWLGCGQDQTWAFRRIHAIRGTDLQLAASGLPDLPIALVKTHTGGFVVTETGLALVGNGAWSDFASGIDGSVAPLAKQMLKERQTGPSGPWSALWAGDENIAAFEAFPAPGPDDAPATSAFVLRTVTGNGRGIAATAGPGFLLRLEGDQAQIEPLTPDASLLWAEPARIGLPPFTLVSTNQHGALRFLDAGAQRAPGLGYANAASVFASGSVIEGMVAVVASDQRAGFWRPSPVASVTAAALPRPLALAYTGVDGVSQSFPLSAPLPELPLPAPDGPVSIQWAAPLAHWWHPRPLALRMRAAASAPWTNADENGAVSLRVAPGTPANFEFSVRTAAGTWAADFISLPADFEDLPRPVFPPWAVALLIVASGTIIVSASRRFQRALWVLLGRRWSFRVGQPDLTLTVKAGEPGRYQIRPRDLAQAGLPAVNTDAQSDITSFKVREGGTVRIEVEGESAFTAAPWPHRLCFRWSAGRASVVAGQIAYLSPEEGVTARLGGAPHRYIAFTAVGFTPEGAGSLATLPAMNDELTACAAVFQRWGAQSHIDRWATIEALGAALTNADIVHVAAHAEADRIYLSDGEFTVADLQRLPTDDLRCRLLVLSACHAGTASTHESLALALVRSGINTIGAVDPLDDIAAKLFFKDLYGALLPERGAMGISIAAAVQEASARLAHDAPAEMTVLDPLVLYGDPTLHLHFG